jgi:transcriptional regulator with XRE-family HTH domain
MLNTLFVGDIRMATFEERFMLLKNEKEVSFKEIADSVHTNRTSLSKFVRGKQKPTKELLEDLSNYFNVDVAYLIGESNIMKGKQQIPEDYVAVSKNAINKKVPAKVLNDFIELWTQKGQ